MDAGAQGIEQSAGGFPDHMQGAGLEEKLLGHKLVPLWDASTAGGNFTCYTTMRAPPCFLI